MMWTLHKNPYTQQSFACGVGRGRWFRNEGGRACADRTVIKMLRKNRCTLEKSQCKYRRKIKCMIVFSAILEAVWILRFSFFFPIQQVTHIPTPYSSVYNGSSSSMRLWDCSLKPATFAAINLSCDLRLIFMEIQLRFFMIFIHAAVSIRRMKWTLILSAASLYEPKITEQIARKIASVNGPLRRLLGTLGERPPPPPPSCSLSKCRDGTNSLNVSAMIVETFFITLNVISLRFRSLLLPLCKMGVIIHIFILLFPDIDECASGTDDCHSSVASCTNTVGSFSCTCNNPYSGNGRTCNLPSGNEENVQLTNPKSLVIDAPCADLDSHCVNSTLYLLLLEFEKMAFETVDHPVVTGHGEYFCFFIVNE